MVDKIPSLETCRIFSSPRKRTATDSFKSRNHMHKPRKPHGSMLFGQSNLRSGVLRDVAVHSPNLLISK